MSDWDVNLEFREGSSSKFWRAKVEGSSVTVNFGRIGTEGQSKSKSYGSADAARADLDKQAQGKRKKGYLDSEGGSGGGAAQQVEEEAQPETPGSLSLSLNRDGRKVTLKLNLEGKTITTEVVESYADEETAQAAMRRIAEGARAEGYR